MFQVTFNVISRYNLAYLYSTETFKNYQQFYICFISINRNRKHQNGTCLQPFSNSYRERQQYVPPLYYVATSYILYRGSGGTNYCRTRQNDNSIYVASETFGTFQFRRVSKKLCNIEQYVNSIQSKRSSEVKKEKKYNYLKKLLSFITNNFNIKLVQYGIPKHKGRKSEECTSNIMLLHPVLCM